MAWFKYDRFLKRFGGNGTAYDDIHVPGTATPYSGIYRCTACDVEIVSEYGKPFPPTHAKAAASHLIRWQMAVYADHENVQT